MSERDFQIFAPLRFFKSGDGERAMRIAGVVSTERPDRQGDTILQRGLDFDYFLKSGWYNDNHSQKTADILGYPTAVQQFQKGDRLPDGSVADSPCTWAEGYLLPDYEPAQRIWTLGQALQKAGGGRSLGFSVEGKIKRRMGPGRKIIAKAEVRNVAVTNCPVNAETKLITLAKSLQDAECMADAEAFEVVKSLMDQFGEPVSAATDRYLWKADAYELEFRKPEKDKTEKALSMTAEGGTGQGAVLARESLERDKRKDTYAKSLTDAEAIALIKARFPSIHDDQTAIRFLGLAQRLNRRGIL